MGAEGRKFEEEFATVLGLRSVCATSSGTDALRIALEAVGVGPGDEVVVPSFTFIATATAVSALGAKPVFADISDETLTLDPAKAAAAVTSRTKAVLPVHLTARPPIWTLSPCSHPAAASRSWRIAPKPT